jgi:hypothetical protein
MAMGNYRRCSKTQGFNPSAFFPALHFWKHHAEHILLVRAQYNLPYAKPVSAGSNNQRNNICFQSRRIKTQVINTLQAIFLLWPLKQ